MLTLYLVLDTNPLNVNENVSQDKQSIFTEHLLLKHLQAATSVLSPYFLLQSLRKSVTKYQHKQTSSVNLRTSNKFTGEHPWRSVISIKLQSNFIEITLRHGCCPVNLQHIFRTSFHNNTYGRLLLYQVSCNLWTAFEKVKLSNLNVDAA